PTVTRDFVGAANPAGRKHDRFRTKNSEAASLSLVTKRTNNAVAVFQQRENRVLHVNLDALMDAVVLQGADHFEAGAIAHMRESRIFMSAEVSLQNTAVLRPIEDRAPGFQLAHAIGRFFGVQLGHASL